MVGKGEAAEQQRKEPEEEEAAGVVKLISAGGFEFVVDKKAAMVSNTRRNMLTSPGGFSETREGEVRFPEISTPILEKICRYFYWSLHYSRILCLTWINGELSWCARQEEGRKDGHHEWGQRTRMGNILLSRDGQLRNQESDR